MQPAQVIIPQTVNRADWGTFKRSLDWRQGEHVMFVGPTGQGKTTLAQELLKIRERKNAHIVSIVTKPKDNVWHGMVADRDYAVIRKWPPKRGQARVILWPKFEGPEDAPNQRNVINDALGAIFAQGGWTVYADELAWLVDGLGLSKWPRTIWQQGRSMKLTFMTGVQRPRNVPLDGYSNSTHLFFWRTNDEEDLRRIGGLGSTNSRVIRATVAQLEQYETLHVNTRTGELTRTKVKL